MNGMLVRMQKKISSNLIFKIFSELKFGIKISFSCAEKFKNESPIKLKKIRMVKIMIHMHISTEMQPHHQTCVRYSGKKMSSKSLEKICEKSLDMSVYGGNGGQSICCPACHLEYGIQNVKFWLTP